ncbi:MAG TPA: hypothetical protein ENJ09_09065 [Planctomycetes bacterium]|nr:hypothetical protein [Planctomycetota bacterium]
MQGPATTDPPAPVPRSRWLGRLLPVLAALLVTLPVLGAGWIAEDASILGRVHRAGALGDWVGPQYGLRIVRFWRPLVTTSWWVELEAFGPHPALLRLLNLALLAGVVLAAGSLARAVASERGGAWWGGELAGLLAALFVGFFPWEGGTVLWLSGRTDLLAALFLLVGTLWALRGAGPFAFVAVFLACASKEFGFEAPLWALLFGWAARVPGPRLKNAVLWTGAAAAGAFLLRGVALGTWLGGYAGARVDGVGGILTALGVFAESSALLAATTLASALAAALAGTLRPRMLFAGLALALAGFLPLLPLASDGVLEPQNLRLLFVPELGFAFALAACVGRRPAEGGGIARIAAYPCLVLPLLLLAFRARAAYADLRAWARAADRALFEEHRARDLLRGADPSPRPVLVAGFPATLGPAYCLNWGVADRFRAPFPTTPRPIWPLRPIFGASGSERKMVRALDADGNLWPWRGAPEMPELRVGFEGSRGSARLVLSRALLEEGVADGVRVSWDDAIAGIAGLEGVVYTELGYLAAPIAPVEGGSAEFTVRSLLGATDGVATLAQGLLQAADTGASHAYLELRALDDRGGVVAASPWIEVAWSDELTAFFLED